MSKILGQRHPLNDAIVWAGFMRAELSCNDTTVTSSANRADEAMGEYRKRWEPMIGDVPVTDRGKPMRLFPGKDPIDG